MNALRPRVRASFSEEPIVAATPRKGPADPFTPDEAQLYETGYRDGENSAIADLWNLVDEEGDQKIRAFFAHFERRRGR